jgi:RNA polymerase sigma-70 factor (ECF subfamily)
VDEQEIIQRVLAGDKECFSLLVDKYYDLAFGRAFSILFSREDAEDVAQDSLLTAFISLKTLKDRRKFSYWLGGIVRRKSIYALRKKIRKREKSECFEHDFATQFAEKKSTGQGLEASIGQERTRAVAEAVAALPRKYREVIYMRYYRNFTYEQIGGFIGLTKSGVDTRLQRGRARLRKKLKAKGISL